MICLKNVSRIWASTNECHFAALVLSDIHFARDIEKLVTQHLSAENPQLTYAE